MNLTILVIGRNAAILETVLRLINSQPGWRGMGALTNEEALSKFAGNTVDLVMFGGGVDDASEAELSRSFRTDKADIRIIRHYGGGSGLLFNEILGAFPPAPTS